MANLERPPSAASSILVVEDDAAIRDVVATALRYQRHQVTQTANGRDGLQLAMTNAFDLIVLDVMLPKLDGYEVCRRLREANRFTPVLFLTARTETADRIKGFITGGDDYLTKPFSVDELVYRVAAILRRVGGQATDPVVTVVTVGDLTLDRTAHEVRRAGDVIELSPTEFGLLDYLMTNTGAVVSKAQILVNVWDYDYDGSDNVVELYIGYLRRKIDDGHEPLIQTRRGVGYVMRATVT
jgi:two-component system, OmpR family, response regulator